jgi:hypothetical protein
MAERIVARLFGLKAIVVTDIVNIAARIELFHVNNAEINVNIVRATSICLWQNIFLIVLIHTQFVIR